MVSIPLSLDMSVGVLLICQGHVFGEENKKNTVPRIFVFRLQKWVCIILLPGRFLPSLPLSYSTCSSQQCEFMRMFVIPWAIICPLLLIIQIVLLAIESFGWWYPVSLDTSENLQVGIISKPLVIIYELLSCRIQAFLGLFTPTNKMLCFCVYEQLVVYMTKTSLT